jgi:iron(III) transport system ATP-binding protein
VAVLRGGTLAQLADPRTLYREPTDLDVAAFVGEAVVLDGAASGGRVASELGELTLGRPCPDGPVRVLLRPEQLRLSAGPGTRARVRGVDFYGHDARVELELPSGLRVSARTEGGALPAEGTEVAVSVQGPAVPFPVAAPARPWVPTPG